MSYETYVALKKGSRIYINIFQKGFSLIALEDLILAIKRGIIAPVVQELINKGIPESEIPDYLSGETVYRACEYIRL